MPGTGLRPRLVIRLAADENFAWRIVRGVRRRQPEIDLVHIQETTLVGADDPTILAWAAAEGRVLLTHDVRAMPRYAYDRVARGQPMAGVFEVKRSIPTARSLPTRFRAN